MKKIALATLLAVAILDAKVITIIDNGIKRKIAIPTPPNGIQARIVQTKQSSLIIAFKKQANVDLATFSSKYNLQLKKSLLGKYYIFKNQSALSDLELISKITKEESSIIQTIRPNWGFNNRPR